MRKRSEIKKAGRQHFRRNFVPCFLACLMFVFLTGGTLSFSETVAADEAILKQIADNTQGTPVATAIQNAINGIEKIQDATSLGNRSNEGVISAVYKNSIKAGGINNAFLSRINRVVFNDGFSSEAISFAGGILSLLFGIFVSGVINVGIYRVFLETRLYPNTPLTRILFIYREKRVLNVASIIVGKYLRLFLWIFTIVGLPIKYYAYYFVSFITAETPDISRKDVFRLSAQMTRGYKWRLFLFDLSFLGWLILSVFTFGLLNYLWLNPYVRSARAELYADLRAEFLSKSADAAELGGEQATLAGGSAGSSGESAGESAGSVGESAGESVTRARKSSRRFREAAFFAGDAMLFDRREAALAEGGVHPAALPDGRSEAAVRRWISLGVKDRYSLLNLALMFFLFAFIGWVWECALEFIAHGTFVNRGTLYGPWIPIYGFGGAFVILLLNRLNKRPMLCFFMSILICGVIEYAGATLLWDLHQIKYWDYSGYFFNIQGRVCLEGLLAFGTLSMTGLYLIAPLTDNLLDKIPVGVRKSICAVLIAGFGSDLVYTQIHPHVGPGITTNLNNNTGS